MRMTFDLKIKALKQEKAELDVSILQSQKQEYEHRLAELLEAQIND